MKWFLLPIDEIIILLERNVFSVLINENLMNYNYMKGMKYPNRKDIFKKRVNKMTSLLACNSF